MRIKSLFLTFGLTAALGLLGGLSPVPAVAAPANNNGVIALQNAGGNPQTLGSVKLEYYGHMAFRLTSPKGLSLFFDPWKNDPSGTWGVWFPKEFPMVTADIALSTHGHYDHNALPRVKSHMILDRVAGQWSLADVRILGLADKHQYKSPGAVRWTDLFAERGIDPVPPNNPPILDNTIFVVETGGLKIVHWGDNRPDAPDAIYKAIGRPDVLILPVDDSIHVLSYAQANKIIERLNPHAIIPAHYLIKGVSSVASTLENADKWCAQQASVEKLQGPVLTLDPAAIQKMDKKILYFGQHVLSE